LRAPHRFSKYVPAFPQRVALLSAQRWQLNVVARRAFERLALAQIYARSASR
jgi:hypothetical protein